MNTELLLKALGEPMRLNILLLLLERKHCVRSLHFRACRFAASEGPALVRSGLR